MVTKNRNQAEKDETKSRVKVGKLQLKKETIKDLTPTQKRQVRGGAIVKPACPKRSDDVT